MKTIKTCLAIATVCGMMVACSETNKRGRQVQDSTDLAKRADSAARLASTTTYNETNEASVDDNAANFMKEAALASTMEIDLGKAAVANSENPKVKEFASKMIADHTMAKSDLIKIAEKSGILLSNDFPSDVKSHMEEMKKMKGKAFDQHYIDMMVKDHVKAIDLFKTGTRLKDNELKDYATKTLPTIEQHYQMAREIKASL